MRSRCTYLLLVIGLFALSLMGQAPTLHLPITGPWPTILGDSIMFIGPTQDSLTEQQRYFNPPYLLVYPGKEHLKEQMIRAAICDCNPTKPNRRIGIFSVGGDQRVCFSQGNLQYLPAANLWKFADQQYQTLAHSNKYASIIYRNWIDLFGYSTDNLSTPFGVSTTTLSAHYAGKFIDWGTNPICGDMPGTWRTLGLDEWDYLLNKRTDAKKLRSLAQIEGINGLILLPDNWICPNELDFIPGANSYTSQNLTLQQWQLLETSEAVFLPAAGIRDSTSLILYNDDGNYWSATRKNNKYANYLVFRDGDTYVDARELIHIARSVRLVHDSIVPEAVDLGLSVKWATFNIGAKAPEDYGNHFAWAEIEPKNQYTWANYIWCQGTYNTLTKYCTNNDYGSIDNITIIESEDDAATMRWQGDWRIPTQAEWKELQSKCTWQWISLNGVSGYKITSKVTGYTDESIFLPAAGYRSGTSYYNHGTHGYYRSSSLYTGDPNETWRLYFHATGISLSHANDRNGGWSIRPVCGPLTQSTATVETIAATQITDQSALVGGKVSHDGGADITEFGIVFGTNTNPTTEDNKIMCSGGIGLFFTNLSSLTPHTTYYVRAFATNLHGTSYGSQITFTTGKFTPTDTTGIENGHAYVDLGLSVLWATCNVGADTPEHSGDYFAWGEIEPKETYNWNTYKWSDNKPSIIYKYNSDHNYGTVDNLTILQPEDDAATANWGGDWRTPTYTELNELRTKCIWVWDKVNGIAGHWVTSKTNGNRIFIPAAGYKSSKTIYNVGMSSYLESSSLRPQSVIEYFYNAFRPSYGTTGAISRYAGLTIRPVCSPHLVNKPSVTTYAATQITAQSALVPGRVTNDGGANIIEHGIVYHTSKNPTISHSKVISHDGISDFRCILENLKTNTTYYARAFATNSAGTAYGTQVTFHTIEPIVTPPTGEDNGHSYVDLGLSVYWGTCNIGATSPQQTGYHFAWGETTTKTTFDWNTYLWYNMEDTVITKYCVSSKYGNVDNLVILDSIDDIAAHMGGAWRMPTDEQWEELRTRCKWYWSYQGGINGYKVVAPNGNSIFLPAAGYRIDTTTHDTDTIGYYWSSNLHLDFSTYARGVSFTNSYLNTFFNGRYCGQSIRPVHDTIVSQPEPKYVDLGLSVKWATFNIGASQPEDYGDYFAWGETEPKEVYNWTNYKWCQGTYNTFKKYCTYHEYGTVDNNVQLDAEDDAATVRWKGDWRMPTDSEWQELYKNCSWKWTTNNGVSGYLITSKIQGYTDKSIFLPAAGHFEDSSLIQSNISGYYASRSLFAGDPYEIWRVHFHSSSISISHSPRRSYGWAIRPVYGPLRYTAPSIETIAPTQVTNNSALVGGKVNNDGGATIQEFGIVYSTSPHPTTVNHRLPCQGGIGMYLVHLTDLQENTTYYVRAYTIFQQDTIYGSEANFTTGSFSPQNTSGMANGHAYIDLGLSVLWATCNLGATTPEGFGDYYAWGETKTKQSYLWNTYTLSQNNGNFLTKYNSDPAKGIVDNKTVLDLEDDAAHVHWGSNWRIPTYQEFSELRNKCTWVWTKHNGVNGYRITSPINGNSIFLPAAGYMKDIYFLYEDYPGDYETSTIFPSDNSSCYYVLLRMGYTSIGSSGRFYGLSIRPVYNENKVPDPCLVVKVNDTLSINMMCVEGGTFTMGASLEDPETLADELPQHEVTLSNYYIGKYEVTQRLWRTIMGSNPSKFIGDDLPVESVTWDECYEFLDKLNAITGLNFRLPTEAEWEYAAQGGNKSKGYTYAGSNNINEVAWYQENCNQTQPVGRKRPNELGIYDMTGNVYEKCSNWYASYPSEPQFDPQGSDTPIIKNCRVVRGGCWYDQGQYTWQHCCRVVDRGYQGLYDRSSYKGLRLVLEVEK